MLKKYRNFMSNQGSFEQPGARALEDFKNLYDAQLEVARLKAVRAAEEERARAEAERAVREEDADAQTVRASGESTPSVDTVMRMHLFPEEVLPRSNVTSPSTSPMRESASAGPVCSICSRRCEIRPNPWQRTRTDIAVSKVVDIEHPPVRHGIALDPCDHIFCGACLAQEIYHSLNMAFDPSTYGTKLPSYVPADVPGLGRDPVQCPTCQTEKRAKPVYITDTTARLVLGELNMDEWNHARFLQTLNLIYCPYRGCNEAFDSDDVIPAGVLHARNRVQCPRCKRSLCRACKSVWHENLTCLMYQALPVHERFSDQRRPSHPDGTSVRRRRPAIYSPTDDPTPWPWDQQQLVAT